MRRRNTPLKISAAKGFGEKSFGKRIAPGRMIFAIFQAIGRLAVRGLDFVLNFRTYINGFRL